MASWSILPSGLREFRVASQAILRGRLGGAPGGGTRGWDADFSSWGDAPRIARWFLVGCADHFAIQGQDIMKISHRAARPHDAEELALIEYSARCSDVDYDKSAASLPLLAERWRRRLRAACRRAGTDEDAFTLIAALGGEDVGVVSVDPPEPGSTRCALWAIYVHGDHQRRGVGTYLLRTVSLLLHERNVVELHVEKCDHASGLAFCQKHRAEMHAGLLSWYDVRALHPPVEP